MARETWVFRDGVMVLKEEAGPLENRGPYFMPDIRPFNTQTGEPITSRSELRAYERRHGIRQIGNDVQPPRLPGEHA